MKNYFLGYVIGTQAPKTVKVRVPFEKYLSKYQKSIIRHRNILAHDEEERVFVGDVVRIVRTIRFSKNKSHAVAEIVKPASKFVDPNTGYVYTNGHLHIPVGVQSEDGKGLINKVSTAKFKEMGLI